MFEPLAIVGMQLPRLGLAPEQVQNLMHDLKAQRLDSLGNFANLDEYVSTLKANLEQYGISHDKVDSIVAMVTSSLSGGMGGGFQNMPGMFGNMFDT
jgi:hypothetical protein